MSKKGQKFRMLALISALLAFALVLFFSIMLFAKIEAYMKTGADISKALNLPVKLDQKSEFSKLDWLPDESDTGRTLDSVTRIILENSYVKAWESYARAIKMKEPKMLDRFFSAPIIDRLKTRIENIGQGDSKIEEAFLSHHTQLHYYSTDGLVVSLTDTKLRRVRTISNDSDYNLSLSEEVVDVTMYLREGRWKIANMARRSVTPIDLAPPKDPAKPTISQNFIPNGVNYYPAKTPWDKFFPNFEPKIIEKDFALINDLGLNCIRVFLPINDFSTKQSSISSLNKLDTLISLAHQNNLKVILTLFDSANYDFEKWPLMVSHLKTIGQKYANSSTVLAWDIKNEPDKDFSLVKREKILFFLKLMLSSLKDTGVKQPTTIGWAEPDNALLLNRWVDYISYHYYGRSSEFLKTNEPIVKKAEGKPVLITEFGLPTWNSFFFPNGHSEEEQSVYYNNLLIEFERSGISGSLLWTLHDFAKVPKWVTGTPFPWNVGPQANMGLIRVDGTWKPAAVNIGSTDKRKKMSLSRSEIWLKPFRVFVYLAMLTVIAVLILIFRQRER